MTEKLGEPNLHSINNTNGAGEMNPKTYSNGAEQVSAEFLTSSGICVGVNLRTEDGFFSCESGFLDAPDFVCSGSTLRGTVRGTTPATIPRIALRT